MVKWLNRVALYIPGLILLLERPVGAATVLIALIALSAGCVCGTLGSRLPVILFSVLWVLLTALLPLSGFFWPLLLIGLFEKRLWPLAALSVISFLVSIREYTLPEVVSVVFCAGLALLLWAAQERLLRLEQENRAIRDEATEASLRLQEKNAELLKEQQSSAKLATLAERSRIAREIHDNVGHMLARSMMQTGAVMTVNQDPDVAEGVEQLRDTLTLAMNSVRKSVHNLHDESLDLYETVRAALSAFTAKSTNLNYDIGADAPQEVKACFAAVVREGLANIAKHSDATRIELRLNEHPRFYQLGLSDNGTSGQTPGGGPGMGLENMRQRTEALGGRFWVRREKGFHIHITIPKEVS